LANFQSFKSTTNLLNVRRWIPGQKVLVDANDAPVGLQTTGNGPDGIWGPTYLSAAQIAAPTALMIADLYANYQLNVPPYTCYRSDGTTLQMMPSTGDSPVFNAASIKGPFLMGTGPVFTDSGLPSNFQVALAADPSVTMSPAYARRNMFFITTLTYSQSTSNIWEGLCVFTNINGPGTANGEINGLHTNTSIEAGAIVTGGECFEGKMQNYGAVNTQWDVYLAISENETTGTAQILRGVHAYGTNANVTSGAVANYTAFEVDLFQGTAPTFYWALRTHDAASMISHAGIAIFGSGGPATVGNIVQISNVNSGTNPLVVKNAAGANLFYIQDAGNGILGGFNFDGVGNLTNVGAMTLAAGPSITSGAGAPSATLPNGSLYLRTNGSASTRLYVSEGGGTWSPIASS
jgi:hypothetical protein